MTRAIILTCTVLLCSGFAWPPDYAEQSRADVSTCVSYARRTSPSFEAWVRGVDLQTGHVDIERSPNDSRGGLAFSRCLLTVRHWRLIERNLPKPGEPHRLDPATMAGRAPDSLTRLAAAGSW
ncbi:MAG: hypothetical protein WEG40_08020 [Candidatus Rokuibacteriota bacterium]